MYCKKVLWFTLICMIKSVQLTENNTSSPVLFTLVGQAALKTAYRHLVIPLNIPDIKKSFDEFEDLEKAMNQLTTGSLKIKLISGLPFLVAFREKFLNPLILLDLWFSSKLLI